MALHVIGKSSGNRAQIPVQLPCVGSESMSRQMSLDHDLMTDHENGMSCEESIAKAEALTLRVQS